MGKYELIVNDGTGWRRLAVSTILPKLYKRMKREAEKALDSGLYTNPSRIRHSIMLEPVYPAYYSMSICVVRYKTPAERRVKYLRARARKSKGE